jgi:hypothetical protein
MGIDLYQRRRKQKTVEQHFAVARTHGDQLLAVRGVRNDNELRGMARC